MKKTIVITSGKGGVGKTTFCSNIALALASKGAKVVLVEGDIGLNNLDVVLGVENQSVYDCGDVITGKVSLPQALIKVSDNIFLLTANAVQSIEIQTEDFVKIIHQLEKVFDYVLIDSPAGLENSFHRACSGAKEAIIVTTPHISSVRDANRTIKVLAGYNLNIISLVVNRVRGDFVTKNTSVSPSEISNILQLPLIGVVPEDDDINRYGIADTEDSSAEFSYYLIASYLMGEDKKIFDCTSKQKKLYKKIFRRWS